MSEQAGVWNFDGEVIDQPFMAKLISAFGRRGPACVGTYNAGSVVMVYRPFCTTPESRLEHQPWVTARGTVITWDGRLDNRSDLIAVLCPDEPNNTDIGIVIAAYDAWGVACFGQFLGDWALSIWDDRDKSLVMARDYVGIRHLYYCSKRQRFLWCTTLDAMVSLSEISLTLNEEYIAGYLAMYPEAHLTPYREICAVPPGTFVRVHAGEVTAHSFWSFNPQQIHYKTDYEYEEHFRHVFRQAVKRRLRSDRPTLAELSGGLDSSSIVCMADAILATESVQTPRLDTISCYDPTEPSWDDLLYLESVERQRGRIGFHVNVAKSKRTLLPGQSAFCPIPGLLGNNEEFTTELSERIRSQGYATLLSGIGGDEFLGGLPDPRPQLADLIVQLRWSELRKQLVAWSLAKRRPWIQLLLRSLFLLLPGRFRSCYDEQAGVEGWIDSSFARRHSLGQLNLGPLDNYGCRLPSHRENARTVTAMSWQMSCRAGDDSRIEYRYPFLDETLVRFVTSIPPDQLLRPGERRSLMRRSLSRFLPAEVLSRKTKATAARRHVLSLQEDWSVLMGLLQSPLSVRLGILDREQFLRTLQAMRTGDMPAQPVRLLRALSLEFWLQHAEREGLILKPVPPPPPYTERNSTRMMKREQRVIS